MADRILFVDDEAHVLSAFQRNLRHEFDVTTVLSGAEALKAIADGPAFAVVLCDMRMPGLDGIETLKRIAGASPDTVRMMLTGDADQITAIKAINEGHIFRFLTKPCHEELLISALRAGVRQYELVTAEKALLEQTLAGSLKMLMDVLAVTLPEAFERAARARSWANPLAKVLNISNPWELELAAILAPIGLITVPPDIVLRANRQEHLSREEKEILDRAPETAHRLIANIPRLQRVAEIVLHQDGDSAAARTSEPSSLLPAARALHVLKDLAAAGDAEYPTSEMIASLRARSSRYAPEVLAATFRIWGTGGDKKSAARRIRREAGIDTLLPGDRLASDIVFASGKLLLGSNIRITAAQIERLRSLRRLEKIAEPIAIDRLAE